MGRMTYWMNVSLDLRIGRSAGDHVADEGGGEWVRIDERLFREFNERARGLALFVEGRIIYEMMETVWPSAAEDESLPDHLREWGKLWTAAPKILVSNSRTTASHNTRIVGGADAITQLAAIRDETDGTIGVGGATLATQLLQHGLMSCCSTPTRRSWDRADLSSTRSPNRWSVTCSSTLHSRAAWP